MLHHAIKHIRQDKNLTQEEVAERLNIAAKTYARLETGETRLDWERIRAIAEMYNMSPEELVAHEGKPIVQTMNVENNDESSNNNPEFNYNNNYYGAEKEVYDQLIAQLRGENERLQREMERIREDMAFLREELIRSRRES